MIRKLACGCLIAVLALAMLFLGLVAALGSLLPSLPNRPVATQVTAGRPCADPIETQGYMPGPGAFEPNHTGIDFACEGSLTLTAVLAGIVVIADDGPCPNTFSTTGKRTFGCNVDIETKLDGRNLFARYGHMTQGSLDVLVGEQVAAGDALGLEGESGYATGYHVHFEIDVGAPSTADCINPVPYLDPTIIHCPCNN